MSHKRNDSIPRWLDAVMQGVSTYAIPILIGLVSLLALLDWKTQYAATEGQKLGLQIIQGQDMEPGPAKTLLRGRPVEPAHETKRSELPVWLSFEVPNEATGGPLVVEFPSRHALDISCWDAASMSLLGRGTREGTFGDIRLVKAGFALDLNSSPEGKSFVCRTTALGPARISALKWRAADLQTSTLEFHRKSGLLDGGILILALFVLVTAIINRSSLYLLFAAWLAVNLRMGGLSAGWDSQWLGNSVPSEWLQVMRPLTLAMYFLLTLELFKRLFRDELKQIGTKWLLRLLEWLSLVLLVLSVVLSYQHFLPIVWAATALGVLVVVTLLVRILQKTPSRVAMWYSVSIAITLISTLYEVIAAALGLRGLIGSINSVTAALSSSLLAALAVAQHMRQEHEQHVQVQAKLKHTYDAMPIGLFTLDLRGRFLSANPAFADMVGKKVNAIAGGSWKQYFGVGGWTRMHQMVYGNGENEIEIAGMGTTEPDDRKRYLVKAAVARDRIEGSLQDVTEKSRATKHLQFLARHDALTQVINRSAIADAFSLAHSQLTSGDNLALAYLDLDRFKLINDLYGHGVGDAVLQLVCQRAQSLLSASHHLGRVGGDEFVIVFEDTTLELADLTCRGILESIGNEPYRVGGKALYVRGSIGLVEVSVGMKFNDAISAADRACHQAKTVNAGGLVVYKKNATAFEQHEAELRLIALLATSSATEGLFLEMQPIMSLAAPDASLDFEVLLRMRDASGALVPTDRLIKAGESSGQMSMIDRWVLSTTLTWLDLHMPLLNKTNFVCINLNGASLNDAQFLQDVYRMFDQHLHLVGHLCLEITESVALQDLDNTRRFVDTVRKYGAKVALDDFGAGYTSFSYLRDFSADLLKIDGSFIVNMNHHPKNVAIVEAIVSLANNLGIKVIAEWAEDQATVQTLTEIGVDYVQGWAVARSQLPERILLAESSASFIQDQALTDFVSRIGRAEPAPTQVNMYSRRATDSLH